MILGRVKSVDFRETMGNLRGHQGGNSHIRMLLHIAENELRWWKAQAGCGDKVATERAMEQVKEWNDLVAACRLGWPQAMAIPPEMKQEEKEEMDKTVTTSETNTNITNMTNTTSIISDKISALGDGDLDNLVHEMKSKEASDINNSSVAAQLEYLRGCGLGDEEIINFVED